MAVWLGLLRRQYVAGDVVVNPGLQNCASTGLVAKATCLFTKPYISPKKASDVRWLFYISTFNRDGLLETAADPHGNLGAEAFQVVHLVFAFDVAPITRIGQVAGFDKQAQ